MKRIALKTKILAIFLLLAVIFVGVFAAVTALSSKSHTEPQAEIISVATLEKIIDISELRTYTAVYNGVAEKRNEKKNDKIDYYVSYNATVTAGIDFEDIQITVDNTSKNIIIKVPDADIQKTHVVIETLDFMFINKKADTATVIEEAYKICQEDIKKESAQQNTICRLAKENAINTLKALTKPIIEQLDEQYTLIIS